jgi:hypothetical protein
MRSIRRNTAFRPVGCGSRSLEVECYTSAWPAGVLSVRAAEGRGLAKCHVTPSLPSHKPEEVTHNATPEANPGAGILYGGLA